MKILKTTALLTGVFSLAAQAQEEFFDPGDISPGVVSNLDLFFRDIKTFKMVGPRESEFLGGELSVNVHDGYFSILGCLANNGFSYVTPNITCPNGTNALVTAGDFDGDGVRDVGTYFSIAQPVPAASIAPFKTDLVELFSAPPSDLPRPLKGFNWRDNSTIVFYDLINDPINGVGYTISNYNSVRPYLPTELERQRREVVPGVYIFKFPALGSTEENPNNFFMSVAHREMVEAVPGPGGASVGGIDVGNDFRVTNDDRWHNGVMEMDPRLFFNFKWEGFNPQTFVGNDRIFFSVRNRETNLIVFPPIPEDAPQLPQLIGSRTLGIPTGYDLGPDFFGPGQEFVVEVSFVRDASSGGSWDRSRRRFLWDIDLIDTFGGFVREAFVRGSPEELIEPDADFDGDGYTNLEEFGFQTSPTDPASVPNPTPVLIGNDQCYLEIAKRPAIGSRLDYIMQYSSDQENWTTIEQGDPNWFIVFNNDERISVLSRSAYNANPCFLRVQFEQN